MLTVQNLSKSFETFRALGPLSFELGEDRVLGILGPSGCGKSTLLRLVAGLETPTAGDMRLDGDQIAGPRADIGVVFQEPRLMPWKTVAENVAFGLWDRPNSQQRTAVEAALAKVGLTEHANRLPKQLSGGMAQRVGIARALVLRPRLLLLDEPFSALDPLTRVRMQDHLLDMVGSDVPNVMLITHDIEEALVLCNRILVLRGPPARVQLDMKVDLPARRQRTSAQFQAYKEVLLRELLPEDAAA